MGTGALFPDVSDAALQKDGMTLVSSPRPSSWHAAGDEATEKLSRQGNIAAVPLIPVDKLSLKLRSAFFPACDEGPRSVRVKGPLLLALSGVRNSL